MVAQPPPACRALWASVPGRDGSHSSKQGPRSAESTSVQIYRVFINRFTVTVSKSIKQCCPWETDWGLRARAPVLNAAQDPPSRGGGPSGRWRPCPPGLHSQPCPLSEPKPHPKTRADCVSLLILEPNPDTNFSREPLTKPMLPSGQGGDRGTLPKPA